jgi:molybdopterin-guanine dinucleotide biosynthesis protein A
MKLLGAIIAGGRSIRFGADKAGALLDGRPLIDHVAAGMRGQTDHFVVCGRSWPGIETVADWPRPELGPLGGLCGAFRHARDNGFDAVLTAGCDVLPIPDSLAARLGAGPACVLGQRLLGLWPATLLPLLESHLRSSTDRSIRTWVTLCHATEIPIAGPWHNINTIIDLDTLAASKRNPATG